MSELNDQSNPASFYASPEEARQAQPEELLYLVCLHEGTGVRAPDFLAVVWVYECEERCKVSWRINLPSQNAQGLIGPIDGVGFQTTFPGPHVSQSL